jgi:hypothetical protein
MKMVLNKRVQGTRHKVSGPLTRDVGGQKYDDNDYHTRIRPWSTCCL